MAGGHVAPPPVTQGGSNIAGRVIDTNTKNNNKERILIEDSEIIEIVKLCLQITII
jgi:hypothetical protein